MSNAPQLGNVVLPPAPGVQLPPAQPGPAMQPPPQTRRIEIMTGLDLQDHLKIVIYGDSGIGKSTFSYSAPAPLILDMQNSTDVLHDWPELRKNCNIWRIPRDSQWETFEEAVKLLKAGQHPSLQGRRTIVLDTVDSLQRGNLEFVLRTGGGNPFLPMEHHYKQSGEMLRRAILDLRDLPYHVVVVMDQTEIFNEVTGQRFIRPGVTPKLAKTLREEFSLMAYMCRSDDHSDQNFHNGLIIKPAPDQAIQCKARRGRFLPSIIDRPTFDGLLAAANQHKEPTQ